MGGPPSISRYWRLETGDWRLESLALRLQNSRILEFQLDRRVNSHSYYAMMR